MNKFTYYLLSLVWGLPVTLIGYLIAVVLLLLGYKPQRWYHAYYFVVGEYWGGVNLGPIFLICKHSNTDYVKEHEYGHGIQNCYYGPLHIFFVALPSMIRCQYRNIRSMAGKINEKDYYSIWFEKQASELGEKYSKKD